MITDLRHSDNASTSPRADFAVLYNASILNRYLAFSDDQEADSWVPKGSSYSWLQLGLMHGSQLQRESASLWAMSRRTKIGGYRGPVPDNLLLHRQLLSRGNQLMVRALFN